MALQTIKVQVFMNTFKNTVEFLQMLTDNNIKLEARPTDNKKLCMMDLPTSFIYDKSISYIFWCEFATESEAAIFKLTHL
jgi:hypothetical protein